MKGFCVTEQFMMHWGDMDALGHANNASYFKWFETARIAYFGKIGLQSGERADVGPILATTTCNFLRPAVYPCDLVAGARVSKMGNTSFTMEYQLSPATDVDNPYATGSGVIVVINYKTGEKIRVPDEMRAKIEGIEATSAP
jgi:acyl-CoA thioester hydrolase